MASAGITTVLLDVDGVVNVLDAPESHVLVASHSGAQAFGDALHNPCSIGSP